MTAKLASRKRTNSGPLLTPREFAGRMGISYPTVKQWLYRGKLRAVRTPGGHYRIPAEEVEKQTQLGGGAVASQKNSGMRSTISGRNQLVGRIEQIKVDGLLAQIKLSLGDQSVTAIITADAVTEMKLKVGDRAAALIKSTEVMIVKE
jgi:molybdopterin-binding protein